MEENLSYHFITPDIDTYFHKDPEDENKYLVITCARGEDDYIVEFVEHYLKLGFDKVIICDNNPTNTIEAILKEYIENNTVEIFNCRGFNSFQVQLYSMFCTEGNYKWCAYFDADEFLELGVYDNIKEFLNTIEEDCISFNWIMYGSNGIKHKTEGTVQERFTVPVKPILMFKENVFVKSILRGGKNRFQNVWFNGSHIPICSNQVTYNIGGLCPVEKADYQSHTYFPPKYRCGYLKHYYTKSFDEWIKKASRGWPDGTTNLHTANYFNCENDHTYPINKYIDSLFIEDKALEAKHTDWKEMLDTYDVIQFNNSSKQVYSFLSQFISILPYCKDHTFVFTEKHIDDTLFAILLEYCLETGNRAVYARTQDEVWKTYLKYSNRKAGTYYILDLL